MDFQELKTRLLALEVSSVCDADKGLRVFDGGIRPVRAGVKFAGRARTVRCHEDFLTVIQALLTAEPDDVLVVDTENSRRAVAGELFTTEAARRGLAAIVIDGPCRDAAGLRALPLPVYARSFNPMAGTVAELRETQIPVTCGGVTVRPGEILFGDDDGLVVLSLDEAAAVIDRAEAIQAAERQVLAHMAAGGSLFDRLNAADHLAAVAAGRESRLHFS